MESLQIRLMSTRACIWAVMFTVLSLHGCNEDDVEGTKVEHVGVVRPAGEVVGTEETHVVGPGGGSVQSADGILRIDIPEGSLAAETTIGIQLIENTAPHGIGSGYRLTPHDVSFQKPVTITFTYAAGEVSMADGLGVAYQDDDGIWYWPGNRSHDRNARKVSIETTHFSDWSLFESMSLMPHESVILPNGEQQIEATRVLPEEMDESLLTPLVLDAPVPLGELTPIDDKYIKEWELIGAGTLAPSGATALYTAPGQIPDQNTATITLEVNLRNGSKSLLLAYVSVIGCEVTLTGGRYSKTTFKSDETAMVTYIAEEDILMIGFFASGPIGDEIMVMLTYPGKDTGRQIWQPQSCYIITQQLIGDKVIYGTSMLEDNPPVSHPGFIEIATYNKELGIMTGTFGGSFTIGEFCTPENCIDYGSIEGTFVGATN